MVRKGAAPAGRPERLLRPKPHLCFVAPHAWPVLSRDTRIQVVGGAEVQQSVLARLFAASGYRVSMISLDYGQPDRVVVDGVTVHKVFAPEAGAPVLRFLHPRLTSMWRALGEVGAEIYYFRSSAMWLGVLTEFCRRHGRRSIYAGASDMDFEPGIGGQVRYARDRWLYRHGLACVDRIVAQNERQRASCLANHGREAVVIPSCYQLPESRNFSGKESRGIVLWVGMIHENKRPELLLELAARLAHRRFVVIGGPRPGAPAAYYERVRAQAAVLPNVEFKGFLPLAEVEGWFDAAQVVVNTSAYEGMPNTFLQAWARGVPTVATVDVGAPVHRVACDVDALAREVESAAQDAVLRGRCRDYFERTHSPAAALERYARLFDELLPQA
jgi:glycosyltransferase involved in cell wall biosynthesis